MISGLFCGLKYVDRCGSTELYCVFGSGSIDPTHLEELQTSGDALGPEVEDVHCEGSSCKMVDTRDTTRQNSTTFGKSRRAAPVHYCIPTEVSRLG